MKKILLSLIIISSLPVLFLSCDKIEEPYMSPSKMGEFTVTATFPTLDTNTVYRKILIEEYTASHCVNCPTGHAKLEELEGIYGDTLIAVGIHATSLAAPTTEYPYDFRTTAGTQLATDYLIDGIPAAIINREYEAGGWAVSRWQSKIQAVDRTRKYAALQLINEYDPINQTLKINTKITMLCSYSNPLQISLFLIENNVIKPQINISTWILDYVHNHVLRSGINGTYGVPINSHTGYLAQGASCTYGYKMSFAGHDWNPDNCTVVAILYDKTNNEVLQVEKLSVK